jgi:hypothetical protein
MDSYSSQKKLDSIVPYNQPGFFFQPLLSSWFLRTAASYGTGTGPTLDQVKPSRGRCYPELGPKVFSFHIRSKKKGKAHIMIIMISYDFQMSRKNITGWWLSLPL